MEVTSSKMKKIWTVIFCEDFSVERLFAEGIEIRRTEDLYGRDSVFWVEF